MEHEREGERVRVTVRESEKAREREGKGEKDKKRGSVRQTDGGEACSSREEEEEEEKQSVLTEEVCVPCGPCAQVGPIYIYYFQRRSSILTFTTSFFPPLCFCLFLQKSVITQGRMAFFLLFRGTGLKRILCVFTSFSGFMNPMQCCFFFFFFF